MKIYAKHLLKALHIDDAISDLMRAMSGGERLIPYLNELIAAAGRVSSASEGEGPTSKDFYNTVFNLGQRAIELKNLIYMARSEISNDYDR